MSKLLKIALAELEEVNITDDKNSVTYDEGGGKKDLVVMTGPLSNIYTKALNLYFAKKDVNDIPTEDVAESSSVATESAMIDTVITSALAKHIDNSESILVNNKIVADSQDIESTPSTIIFSTDANSAQNPEVISAAEIESAKYEDSDKEWFVFVGPSKDGDINSELITQAVEVDADESNDTNAFNAADQFKRATESFYASRGMTVVFGFEKLIERLKMRPKAK